MINIYIFYKLAHTAVANDTVYRRHRQSVAHGKDLCMFAVVPADHSAPEKR